MRGERTWCTAYLARTMRPAEIIAQLATAEEVAVIEHRMKGKLRVMGLIMRTPGEGWRDLDGEPLTLSQIG